MYNMEGSKLFSNYNKNQEKVRSFFQDSRVVVAYLFGSASENNIGPLSDLDFAVYLDENLPKEESSKTYMNILNNLISILGDNLDLVQMNNTDNLMNFNIIKTGKKIYERSVNERIKLESRIMQKNLDQKYYRQRHVDNKLRKIVKEGLK